MNNHTTMGIDPNRAYKSEVGVDLGYAVDLGSALAPLSTIIGRLTELNTVANELNTRLYRVNVGLAGHVPENAGSERAQEAPDDGAVHIIADKLTSLYDTLAEITKQTSRLEEL